MPSTSSKKQPEAESIFAPKFWTTIQSYSSGQFWNDLSAGVIVGIVALPLAIAFAIASGVTPDRGLTTAVIAGFLISALGGSRVQIGGPTGAFVVIVYGIVQRYGIDGLILCTAMAGAILVLMGILRLGTIIKFIPYPLTVGFTAGIAAIIFSSQIKDFFGMATPPLPADFVGKWNVYFHSIDTIDPATLSVGIFSLLILMVWPKINRKIPGSIIAILLVTPLVYFLHIPIETIGSRFGAIPTGLPPFSWPRLESFQEIRRLVAPAFTVAMLGAIESLLSATVADGMIEGRHRSNTELIAQGFANIMTPLFGGIPATGAIARTATNVKNGGRTPMAGIIHSATLFLIMLVFGRWAAYIPMAVLAAILIIVSYYMSEWHAFRSLLRAPKMDVVVLLVTFFLTILVDLTVAVQVGMLLAMLSFMKRMTDVTTIREVTREIQSPVDEETLHQQKDSITRRTIPEEVDIYEAEGAFFFGVASRIRDNLRIGKDPPKVLILRLRHVHAMDASGIQALKELRKSCAGARTQLIIEGLAPQPRYALSRAGMLEVLGAENVVPSLDAALARANQVISS